jgi:hypothetical protein
VTADKKNAVIMTPPMVRAGMHINAVGGDCPGKTELHGDILRMPGARVYVEYEPQSRIEGEIQQMEADFPVTEFATLLGNPAIGRAADADITIFDSVGFALQDYSALRYLHMLLHEERGSHRQIDLVPSLDDPKDLYGGTIGCRKAGAVAPDGLTRGHPDRIDRRADRYRRRHRAARRWVPKRCAWPASPRCWNHRASSVHDRAILRVRAIPGCPRKMVTAISMKSSRGTISCTMPFTVNCRHRACRSCSAAIIRWHRFDQRGRASLPRARSQLRVLWLDAHADFNTSVLTPSGNIHGMPVACLCGHGPRALLEIGGRVPAINARSVDRQIGIRSVDQGEKRLVHEIGLEVFDMRYIDEMGMRHTLEQALAGDRREYPPARQLRRGFPRSGNRARRRHDGGRWSLLPRAQLCMEMIADTGRLASLDIMELNPALDVRNRTAEVAVDLVASLFGKSTLMRRA